MPLYYRCTGCGGEHLSPISFTDRSAYQATHLSRNAFQCPITENWARYEKRSLYWKAEVPPVEVAHSDEAIGSVRQGRLAEARILVVDDERPLTLMLERLLGRSGYREIASTTNPLEVLDLVQSFRPDILLLDLQMPHADGFDVLRALQPRLSSADFLPVLVLTGDATPEARQRALAEGARDFVGKPFDRVEVLLRVRNLLETRFLCLQLQEQVRVLEERLWEHERKRSPAERLLAGSG